MSDGPTELFPSAEVAKLSPRLAFLAKHCLHTYKQPDGLYVCEFDEDNLARGTTEENAILEYCDHHGLKHYSLE